MNFPIRRIYIIFAYCRYSFDINKGKWLLEANDFNAGPYAPKVNHQYMHKKNMWMNIAENLEKNQDFEGFKPMTAASLLL